MSYDSSQDWQMQSPAWRDEQIHKCLCTMKGLMENLSGGYSVYRALISQSGGSAPTAYVLENSLGETPVFAYLDTGKYSLSTTGSIFTQNKTFILVRNPSMGDPTDAKSFFFASWMSNSLIHLISLNYSSGSFDGANGILNNCEIEILVYP